MTVDFGFIPYSLSVTKDDGLSVVAPGSLLTYTIEIINNGAENLTDITATDTLPGDVIFQSAVPAPTTNAGGILTWDHAGLGLTGPFAPGASTSISLTVRVRDNADIPAGVSDITNSVSISDSVTGTTDSDDDTNTLARTNTKALTDTNHAQTVFPEVAIGEILTYRISLIVPAGVTMTNLRAVDVLETGLAFDECLSVTSTDLTSTINPGNPSDLSGACPAAAGDPNVTDAGHNIIFDFGDVTNTNATEDRTLSVDYWVDVLDIAENNNGVTGINNAVTWQWDGGSLAGFALPVEIVEPDMSIQKTVSPEVALLGSTLTFTVDVEHTAVSRADAYDVVITDILPPGLGYVDGSFAFATGALTTPNVAYDATTTTLTVAWDHFPLLATSSFTFDAIFVGPSPVTNEASAAWTSLPIDPQPDGTPVQQSNYNAEFTERWYDPLDTTGVDDYRVSSSVSIRKPNLPKTGFAPGRITPLPEQPRDKDYQQMASMTLEIPRLGVNLPIVGVPGH